MARLRNALLYVLTGTLLILGGIWAERVAIEVDLSKYGVNYPAPATAALLQNLDQPVSITAFLPDHPVPRRQIGDLVERLGRTGAKIDLSFVDPAREPGRTRAAGVRKAGSLQISYAGRSERVEYADEAHFAEALLRLSRQGAPWIVTLTGHGERQFSGAAPSDLGRFGALIEQRGYRLLALSLTDTPQLPENAALVVLAAPTTDLTAAELDALDAWLEAGGNLLWLTEDARPHRLSAQLGLAPLPGIVVDAMAANLGYETPAVAVSARHPSHPVTAGLDAPVVVPQARGWLIQPRDDWRSDTLLRSSPQSWNETGALSGRIKRDTEHDERAGPIALAVALSRTSPKGPQRIAVIGDADLLSDAFLGQHANRDFGTALIHWLTAESKLVGVPPDRTPDGRLGWSAPTAAALMAIQVIGLPLLLVLFGLRIRHVRRKS